MYPTLAQNWTVDKSILWVEAIGNWATRLCTVYLSRIGRVPNYGWRCFGFPRGELDSTSGSCSLTYLRCVSRISRAFKPTHFAQEHNIFETQQVKAFGQERPEVGQCRRVAKWWFRWLESQGVQYPQGIEGIWTCIWELVTIMPIIEDANTNYLA